MKKIIITILLVGIAAVAYWLISPLFLNKEVSEALEMTPDSVVFKTGNFIGLANHSASGMAKLIKMGEKYVVRFEDDFMVTNGPDLFVYLGKNGEYDSNTQLAALKGNVGSQNYEIPANINVADYNEVWVWCRAFSVAFGKAELK